MTAQQRARELAQFFGMTEADALAKLNLGFGHHHAEVTADWKRANPQTDDEILEWYRKTDAYIWELSAYHLDPGFNYMGMCAGISEALRAKGVDGHVLCLGDGVVDLTAQLREDGFKWAIYHDLEGSRTAQFAAHCMKSRDLFMLTPGWSPCMLGLPEPGSIHDTEKNRDFFSYQAVISLDFLEHVVCVEDWLRAIYAALKPGGWALLQNAFAIGSGPDGSIPCHLERNDKYETEYGPLMLEIGFVQDGTSNWWRK